MANQNLKVGDKHTHNQDGKYSISLITDLGPKRQNISSFQS